MQKSEWKVTHVPDASDVLHEIMSPRENLTFIISIQHITTRQRHTLVVKVDDMWAGRKAEKKDRFGCVEFAGTTSSKFIQACPALCARVSVSFKIGEEEGWLELVELTEPKEEVA